MNYTTKNAMIGLLLVGVTSLSAIGTSRAETGQLPDADAVERGRSLYQQNCLTCHQPDGVGEHIPRGIRSPTFMLAMPLNETSHAWHHSDDQLVKTIQKGNQRMPAFAQVLPESDIRDLVAYMKSLWSARIVACQGPKHMSCM